MGIGRILGGWLRPMFFLGRNPLSLIGAVLTTSAAITMIAFWVFEMTGGHHVNPYVGILFLLILPGLFLFGLVLIPIGLVLQRRKLKKRGELPAEYPKIDLGNTILRRGIGLVTVLTIANVFILALASYKGVHYMDSVEFCGTACHTVMEPEYVAFKDSPHERVGCVQCHIGPGADWFVKAKISGLRQVLAVTFNTFSKPIPSPVHELRPARETCEQCHWPQKFTGERLFVRKHYAEDEANTEETNVLLMNIGGKAPEGNVGIHGRHLDEMERITYVTTDRQRQVIPKVTYIQDDGTVVEYISEETQPKADYKGFTETRKMDCVDCHNRPTHAFEMPDKAVDKRIAAGEISQSVPFIKKKGVEVLLVEYPDRETAKQKIATSLTDYYKTSHPEFYQKHRALVENAVRSVQGIYARNIFPKMKVTWGTHPNNIGHEDFLGCFRCHDGNHKSKEGKVISADCESCHKVLAMGEDKPKILQDMGLK